MRNLIIGIVVLSGFLAFGLQVFTDNKNVNVINQAEPAKQVSGAVEVGLQKGDKAPDFTLYSLEGEEVSLSDYKGKVTFINFWTTWCPPCKKEMPDMQEFYEEKAEEYDAEILSINITTNESSSQVVEDFVKENALTFPVLLDENGEQSNTFATITIPTTYLVDKNGIIMKRVIGPMNKEQMVELAPSVE
ncbi:TlpA family protein disulfide reductase [Pseudalkalibacillus sp. NRS-1564]|uniref:TlpA family protein disulfide reductase n=1 Tax=Pseudalkalibacillus sp. NRS-1564 TaxID=3233900 RepID=UPI003D2D07E0